MISKVLAWASFGAALLFSVLAVGSLVARESLGENGPMLVFYGGIPLLVLSILLAIALLVIAATSTDA